LKEIAGNSLGMFLGFLRYGKKSCNQLVNVVEMPVCTRQNQKEFSLNFSLTIMDKTLSNWSNC